MQSPQRPRKQSRNLLNHKRRDSRVYLSLGSNLGDRGKHLHDALVMLSGFLTEMRASRIYETSPLLFTRQPGFLNCAVCGNYSGTPKSLLERIWHIERVLKRKRVKRNGPRTIDVDILLFGNKMENHPHLVIPHPEIENRRFVLVPVLELEPGLRHPVTGEYLWKYLDKNHAQGVYFHSFSGYTTQNSLNNTNKDYGRDKISHRPV